MKFDDLHMIEQTMSTHITEVEALYWLLEDAVYKDKSSKMQSILEILLYIVKYKPELIRDGLQAPHRERLKILSLEILGNTSIREKEAVSIKPSINPKKIPFKLESELKEYLVKHKDKLSKALNDQIRIVGVEVEADAEGEYRCDIVAESTSTFYPIELKINQSTHAVVSQCSKYCYYFYRKLRYNHFKKVQGIVITNGADAWSVNELRREGHWVYIITPISDTDITLDRVR